MKTDDDPAVSWLTRELRKYRRTRPKRFQVSDTARHAHELFEANTATLAKDHLACARGCGSCCCAQVGVETAEAFSIIRHIRAALPVDEAEKLLDRVAGMAKKIEGMDPGQRWEAQYPCVFLHPERGDCTVYAVRPLACRGYNSTNLDDCLKSKKNRDHAHPIPADSELMLRAMQLRHALAAVTSSVVEDASSAEEQELHAGVTWASGYGDELAWSRSIKHNKKKKGAE